MKIGLLIGLIVAVAVALLIASSMRGNPRYRVQVCMYFDARFNCKIVSGRNEQGTLRTAVQNACADIASGVTEVVNCESSEPKSVKWLERPKAAQ